MWVLVGNFVSKDEVTTHWLRPGREYTVGRRKTSGEQSTDFAFGSSIVSRKHLTIKVYPVSDDIVRPAGTDLTSKTTYRVTVRTESKSLSLLHALPGYTGDLRSRESQARSNAVAQDELDYIRPAATPSECFLGERAGEREAHVLEAHGDKTNTETEVLPGDEIMVTKDRSLVLRFEWRPLVTYCQGKVSAELIQRAKTLGMSCITGSLAEAQNISYYLARKATVALTPKLFLALARAIPLVTDGFFAALDPLTQCPPIPDAIEVELRASGVPDVNAEAQIERKREAWQTHSAGSDINFWKSSPLEISFEEPRDYLGVDSPWPDPVKFGIKLARTEWMAASPRGMFVQPARPRLFKQMIFVGHDNQIQRAATEEYPGVISAAGGTSIEVSGDGRSLQECRKKLQDLVNENVGKHVMFFKSFIDPDSTWLEAATAHPKIYLLEHMDVLSMIFKATVNLDDFKRKAPHSPVESMQQRAPSIAPSDIQSLASGPMPTGPTEFPPTVPGQQSGKPKRPVRPPSSVNAPKFDTFAAFDDSMDRVPEGSLPELAQEQTNGTVASSSALPSRRAIVRKRLATQSNNPSRLPGFDDSDSDKEPAAVSEVPIFTTDEGDRPAKRARTGTPVVEPIAENPAARGRKRSAKEDADEVMTLDDEAGRPTKQSKAPKRGKILPVQEEPDTDDDRYLQIKTKARGKDKDNDARLNAEFNALKLVKPIMHKPIVDKGERLRFDGPEERAFELSKEDANKPSTQCKFLKVYFEVQPRPAKVQPVLGSTGLPNYKGFVPKNQSMPQRRQRPEVVFHVSQPDDFGLGEQYLQGRPKTRKKKVIVGQSQLPEESDVSLEDEDEVPKLSIRTRGVRNVPIIENVHTTSDEELEDDDAFTLQSQKGAAPRTSAGRRAAKSTISPTKRNEIIVDSSSDSDDLTFKGFKSTSVLSNKPTRARRK
ncbi:uncharacterized protein L969DRAFT_103924 [Mixia osmundae IAM 14324]|uniref:FHA domain-containing protein n=1 Tax=Mixia osmundae (strain CBS 9802 / IAM 14324 / JCM 22182 / KY 12970) TaxID=764103 RepID=G7E765_MIXOS|nr:uncharacterized protein L969DRAFT_103924 [Mixia osmundae IAM 14324]KEI38939.1 hypothetical protein L969DRAFT_103924 [Mixia osmundae IAM 14324]GAA98675.1 hypothetical protein E5Q_05363 [Mixia osmundae IAM 14324]